ncbi:MULTISPECIES: PaaX family transcriptional regulator C-terminal domain-containing protein [unclassified Leifsonia]|uniref:PaaX family transcriptional regulator n=1 Tax=unclassified Leifsonia TaxID=2663824 RepID=UPI0008A729D6|nr:MULTISPECIES: PaaX family transcriptional regulator C-terminal domain-containing protein [unclassified Leifsonia]SEI12162.1 transcriptional regulator, PaaX family [Leifsonia sp. CL154]SFL94013.1 transcriptional regulator, PaaX family [Leifsonia sp. CL147]
MTDTAAARTVARTHPESAARDDLEAGSGSATALLRTVVGSVLRPIGGWMSAAGAVRLMDGLGVPSATARSSLARLCSRGVLRREPREGTAGYALDPAAVPMLERGDRRIFGDRVEASRWVLVSLSFPERSRSDRDRLRRRLAALGCGTVADGLWIAPSALEDELAEAVSAIADTSDSAAERGRGGTFRASEAAVALFADASPRGDLATGLARWYDLPAIRAAHESFLSHFADAPRPDAPGPDDDAQAFAVWMRALDEWRVIPYRDPGLPSAALAPDWPGAASAALFQRLRRDLEARAVAHAASVATSDRVPATTR